MALEQATNQLRFVKRDGKFILQQLFTIIINEGGHTTYTKKWVDVPVEEEKEE